MNNVELGIAQAVVRGVNTALPIVRKIMKDNGLNDSEDERFLVAMERAAQAAKDWVRDKAVKMGRENKEISES